MREWNERSGTRAAVLGDAAICLSFALLLRFVTFGDPDIHIDEAFYFYVGLEMHQGAIPYVDIWDRKPLGLFILYSLFAGISSSVLAYQIPAWLFVSYTAWVITRIVSLFGSRLAGLLAAGAYLALLLPLSGHGGQSPVFYNAFVSSAVWLVMLSDDRLKHGEVPAGAWGAMALGGLAITIKQTALFESAFLGLWLVWRLWRSGMPLPRLATYTTGFAALGALPFVSIAAWYLVNGYWDRYWFAMVSSNTERPFITFAIIHNLGILFHALALLITSALATVILAFRDSGYRKYSDFLIGWLSSSILGLIIVPNFFDHYAIPLVVPLTVIGAWNYGRSLVGGVLGFTIIISAMFLVNPFAYEIHETSRYHFTNMVKEIERNFGSGKLYVYEGPMGLNSIPNVRQMTEIVFQYHLTSVSETGTSPVDQLDEIEAIISQRPDLVVFPTFEQTQSEPVGLDIVRRYAYNNCKLLYVGRRSQRRMEERWEKEKSYLYGRCNEAR